MNANRKIVFRALALCAAALIMVLAGLKLIDRWHAQQYQESRGTGTQEFMASNQAVWEGATYKKTSAVTTLLIAGIDRDVSDQQGVGTSRYRNGGQADFLLLLAIDHTHRQIHQLQIDRDTMADVTVLSVFGQETGTRVMQICLSHSYGANAEENARYTMRAVRKLMNDIEIDGYYMVDYSAIPILNDALGGVTVTVPVDMTSVNPAWKAGAAVTLHGDEAELFVRTRKTVGEGTNAERMGRQGLFMQNAILKMREQLSDDASFAGTLLSALKAKSATNLSDQQWIKEIQNSLGYEVLPIEYLDGQYAVGESGYMEFYAAEGSAENWIMHHLYTKQ